MKVSQYLAESPKPKLTDALVVNASCLILPDLEVPFQQSKFVNKCIALALQWDIRDLIMAGDWFHWAALAKFFEADKDAEEEIELIEETIEPIIQPFDRVYYIAGNHDRRPQRMFDRFVGSDKMTRLVVKPELAMEFRQKVSPSDYFWCWVGEGEDRWRITHPQTTTTVPANAARMLAEKFNCNVAMAHNHLVGMQQTRDSRHSGYEIGCCVDPERLAYHQYRDITRPQMQNGALILIRSKDIFYPTLLTPKTIDGEFLKGAYGEKACIKHNR